MLYLALAVVLCSTRPYKGSKKNFRPMANYIIMIVIAGILLAIASTGDASGIVAEYGPLVILVLLFVAVVYSGYALVRELCQKCDSREEQKQD